MVSKAKFLIYFIIVGFFGIGNAMDMNKWQNLYKSNETQRNTPRSNNQNSWCTWFKLMDKGVGVVNLLNISLLSWQVGLAFTNNPRFNRTILKRSFLASIVLYGAGETLGNKIKQCQKYK